MFLNMFCQQPTREPLKTMKIAIIAIARFAAILVWYTGVFFSFSLVGVCSVMLSSTLPCIVFGRAYQKRSGYIYNHPIYICIRVCTDVTFITRRVVLQFDCDMLMNDGISKKRKSNQVKWIDSKSRFFALVSSTQDSLPFIRMDLRVPSTPEEDICCGLVDNLFIPLQEVIFLRPYQPYNAMILLNPTIYEVVVHVQNFWSVHESGGNSGRPIRRGTMYVTGETEALQRLCGKKDTRFTRRHNRSLKGDASGVRGIEHTLKGGIQIKRIQKSKLESTTKVPITDFVHAWVCIDYSSNHIFYCKSIPACSSRSGQQAASVNSTCLHRDELFLRRQPDNPNDANAISVVCANGDHIVGFVPRELAACLAPCIDNGVVTVQQKGVYSEVDVGGDPHNRVWFRVDAGIPMSGDTDLLNKSLSAIPWWIDVSVNGE
jgi:hypothetical protein